MENHRVFFLLPALCIIQAPEIQATVQSYVDATIRHDAGYLDKILAKNYLEVSPLGKVDAREKVLSFYRVPKEQRGPAITGTIPSGISGP